MKKLILSTALVLSILLLIITPSHSKETLIPVTYDNYNQAETARNFNNWASLGANNKMLHRAELSPIGKDAPTVRMNLDTLYSLGVYDNDGDMTVTIPESNLYQSIMIIDTDGYTPFLFLEPGVHSVKHDSETLFVTVRTVVKDRHSQASFEEARAAQARIKVEGNGPEPYVMPSYDQEQLHKLTAEYKKSMLDSGIPFTYGDGIEPVNEKHRTWSNSAGWGGMVTKVGFSNYYTTSENLSGDKCMAVTFPETGNKYFTSFTIYDTGGYLMEGNSHINSYTWTPNDDSSITIRFNCKGEMNNISSGGSEYNYLVRHYGVSQKVIDKVINPIVPLPANGTEASTTSSNVITLANTRQLAEDTYVYGLQQVIFYQTRYNYTQNEATNVFEGTNSWNVVNDGNPIDTNFKAIVTPNATTAYAIGFIDIQAQPVVIEMPKVSDRYFSLQLMGPYGIFHLYAGNQFNGTGAHAYLIVPEDYHGEIPDDFPSVDIIKTPSKTLTGIVRYARTHPEKTSEIDHIKGLLAQTTITPLDSWIANGHKGLSKTKQPVVKGDYKTFPRMKEIKAQVDEQTAEDFFTFMQLVLNDPSITPIEDSKMEAVMLDRLADIGLAKGKNFNFATFDEAIKKALTEGFKAGRLSVKKAGKDKLIDMNGWGVIGQAGSFATHWMDSSIMADIGWLGPDRSISHSAAFAFTDSEGKPLSGSKNYTITFDMDDLPPVSEFWSVPMYDADGYFIENEMNRFSINSFQLNGGLLHTEDGKLVLYLQHKKPTNPNQAKNWLPTPVQGFRMTPRFYGPSSSIISGSYKMPGVIEIK